MLEVRNLSVCLGDFALRDLNLRVEQGQYYVLLGPSGVGKTVLLETIAGLHSPTAGVISWDGVEITRIAPEVRSFGMVYQDQSLFPHLSVQENLEYGLRVREVARAERSRQARDVAQLLGVGHVLTHRPETLSGGERQRVALGRALLVKPRLLLLDEPLSALDQNEALRLRRLLRQLQSERQTTFLHVTHNAEEAMSLAERVGVLLAGTLRQEGTPVDLYRYPTDSAVADFIGIANVFPVVYRAPGECALGDIQVFAEALTPETRYILIRPEEVTISLAPFVSSARNQWLCTVTDKEYRELHVTLHLHSQGVDFLSAISYTSDRNLDLAKGSKVFATFKSNAVHCF